MKAKNVFFIVFALVFMHSVIGCNDPIAKEDVILSTPEELVSRMNREFDGDFEYLSHTIDDTYKTILVKMKCCLNNKILNVEVRESHYNDFYFYPHFEKNGTFTTNYYAVLYAAETKEYFETYLKNFLEYEDLISNVEIKTNPDNNKTALDKKFSTSETYINHIKEYGIIVQELDVPYKKDENATLELKLLALESEKRNKTDFLWIVLDVKYKE